MSTKKKLELLDRLLQARDDLTRRKMNAVLRGEAAMTDCPECLAAQRRCDRLRGLLVRAIGGAGAEGVRPTRRERI